MINPAVQLDRLSPGTIAETDAATAQKPVRHPTKGNFAAASCICLGLAACAADSQKIGVSDFGGLGTAEIGRAVSVTAYTRPLEPSVEAYPTAQALAADDYKSCVPVIVSSQQLEDLKKLKGLPITLSGNLTANPDTMTGPLSFDVKVEGRPWHGSLCNSATAIFLDGFRISK